MITATTETVPGKRVVRVLGVARGNTIRARHMGRDLLAVMRNLVGGEILEYTKLMGEAREQAVDRMIADAERMGANAILGMRFSTAMIMTAAAEILCYGTAVVLEDE